MMKTNSSTEIVLLRDQYIFDKQERFSVFSRYSGFSVSGNNWGNATKCYKHITLSKRLYQDYSVIQTDISLRFSPLERPKAQFRTLLTTVPFYSFDLNSIGVLHRYNRYTVQ